MLFHCDFPNKEKPKSPVMGFSATGAVAEAEAGWNGQQPPASLCSSPEGCEL